MTKKSQSDNFLKPRKAPRQKRSQNTMDVILQATGELICARGLDGFGTNQIADRAGVSIGSLYQYFPDKEAILACMIRDMRRQMLHDFSKALDDTKDQSMLAAIDELVTAALRHHMRNPELTRHLERAEDDLPLDHETQALKLAMAELVANLLRKHSIESPEDTAFDLIALAHGLTHAATQAGQSNFKNLRRRVMRAVVGYLENSM
jgi:AcrR family transcriptional regulator